MKALTLECNSGGGGIPQWGEDALLVQCRELSRDAGCFWFGNGALALLCFPVSVVVA